jgi:hypothetical protein
MSKYQLKANLPFLCKGYRNMLSYICNWEKRSKLEDRTKMMDPIKHYLSLPTGTSQEDPLVEWIWTLDKLDPIFYKKKVDGLESIGGDQSDALFDEHLRQLDFCHKVFPIIEDIDFKHNELPRKDYYQFINACKAKGEQRVELGKVGYEQKMQLDRIVNPDLMQDFVRHCHRMDNKLDCENGKNLIIPNLMQDFMWHSHMMDNKLYCEDMQNILGYILGHRTSLTPNEKLHGKTSNSVGASSDLMLLTPIIALAAMANHDDKKTNSDDDTPPATSHQPIIAVCGSSHDSSTSSSCSSCGSSSCGGGGCGS